MAQILQPLFILALIITLIQQPKGVKSLAHTDYQTLMDIKNCASKNQLKEIWNSDYKHLVKNIDPGLLRTRKRGKRAGIRVNHSTNKGKVPLPAVIITNAQSVRHKLDELHALLQTKRLINLSQLICITESWLTPEITKSRTELDGYSQYRNDRLPDKSGKSCGGGILVYIDNKWSTNNQIIHNHTDEHLEIMTVKSRPHWLPREFTSVISVSCYAPFTGKSRLKANATSTSKIISMHVKQMERKYPDACVLVMGDFNQLPLKLDGYYQVVKSHTRNNKILDKCYTKVKNGYTQCRQLAKLGGSDHFVMQLIPSYIPLSKNKPVKLTRRDYSEENCDNLKACLDTTIWDNIISENDTIDQQTEVFTDYIKFCTDLCIPTKTITKRNNSKPWITKDIANLIDQKQDAHETGNKKLYHKLKRLITREMKKSKKDYSLKIQQHLAKEPAKAWTDIKKLSGLPINNSAPVKNDFTPDELNTFFTRYEKPHTNHADILPDAHTNTAPPLEISEDNVLKQLKYLNPRKGAGPDGIIPKVMKLCCYQLAPTITRLFNSSLSSKKIPTLWKKAIIKPLPKVNNPKEIKQYRPIALTSCLCKVMERLIKHYVITHTPLDTHQFAYRSHRSTQDAILCLTSTVTSFIDKIATNYARCLFLDFSSAFNTINVSNLISQLHHLDSAVTEWICSFLSDRVQRTMVDGTLSHPITTNTGTPQGSVLSPLLFSIYTDRITSTLSNVTVIKYADDTCIIGCISNKQDLDSYFNEIDRISRQCVDLDLLLNASKTQEILFSTQRTKPDSPPIVLNGQGITMCDKVTYLGVLLDQKLRFEDHVQSVVSKAEQRMYIVRNFVHLSTVPLATMLFKSFIVSLLTYCLPILYTHVFAKDKKCLRKFFKEAANLGLEVGDLDSLIQKRTKTLAMTYIHDDTHFLNDFLEKCPSGRYRTIKYRSALGKDSFVRHLIHTLNDILF